MTWATQAAVVFIERKGRAGQAVELIWWWSEVVDRLVQTRQVGRSGCKSEWCTRCALLGVKALSIRLSIRGFAATKKFSLSCLVANWDALFAIIPSTRHENHERSSHAADNVHQTL
jgi:hypothetical protein